MREYVLFHHKDNKDYLIGIFTNRKKVFEAMEQIEIADCYIKGVRKNIPLNLSSFGANITDKIVIYKNIDNEEQYVYKVLELHPNYFNPYLKPIYTDINQNVFNVVEK